MTRWEEIREAAKAEREAREARDRSFYEEVASILGAIHEGLPFEWHARTRWNNRVPGQGRYPGFGTVRLFGETVHVALRGPVHLNLAVEGRDEALDAIRAALSPPRDRTDD